ncbi:hypothetical protein AYI68_g6737 [Smittium mucronatum]|uniref:Uncharacterized protein n=1 Tax=Smittium mucronatum TaxID=133383 RepID=A0A1R0GQM9_9FUNG|nr:hypothetical protein AYI68_g6737 [Smittium mucronatum]
MPIGCYGGETFCMSEARVKPIHAEIDKAIRLVANIGKSAAMERRAYHKWPSLKTWIAGLIKWPFNTRIATWVTGSARWIKNICVQNSKGETTITIVESKNKNNWSKIRQWKVDPKIGGKGNWMNLQLLYPDLKLSLQEIGKMRMGTFRTVQ